MTGPREQPIGQALLVCDQIITDAPTNKKSLIGVFNNLMALSFPVLHPSMCVFAALTNGNGQMEATLRCTVDAEEVMKASGRIEFPDPNQVIELVFNLRGIVFPRPGMYTFELLCDGEFVIEKRFQVTKVEPPH
jgi:hypothetical protein